MRDTKAKLTARSGELANTRQDPEKVQSFIVPLTNLEGVRDQVFVLPPIRLSHLPLSTQGLTVTACASLNATFSEAVGFFQSFFGRDLDKVILDNRKAAWDKIRDIPSVYRVPLPASNSAHAKRMRVIASLIIYAQALSRHVFRPTYIIQNNHDELDQMLDSLARESPLQEAYVRAVLLRTTSDSREMHRETCSTVVASDVAGVIAGWLSASERETFHSAVKRLSEDACEGWEYVQRLVDRVRPSFVFELSEDWQRLPSPTQSMVQNGTAHEEEPLALAEAERRQITDEERTLIWPAFFASSPSQTDDEALDRLHCGYTLTRADVEDAEAEIYEESRRTDRKMHRRNDSISRNQGKNPMSFLSSDGSGGQDGK